MDKYQINSDATIATYGLYFLKGTLAQLKQIPIRKEPIYKFSWKDENGATYNDLEPPKFETIRFELPCLMKGESFAAFNAFYDAFYSLITTETFFYLKSETLNKSFKVRYIAANGLNLIRYIEDSTGQVGCPFTLVLDWDYEYEPVAPPEP